MCTNMTAVNNRAFFRIGMLLLVSVGQFAVADLNVHQISADFSSAHIQDMIQRVIHLGMQKRKHQQQKKRGVTEQQKQVLTVDNYYYLGMSNSSSDSDLIDVSRPSDSSRYLQASSGIQVDQSSIQIIKQLGDISQAQKQTQTAEDELQLQFRSTSSNSSNNNSSNNRNNNTEEAKKEERTTAEILGIVSDLRGHHLNFDSRNEEETRHYSYHDSNQERSSAVVNVDTDCILSSLLVNRLNSHSANFEEDERKKGVSNIMNPTARTASLIRKIYGTTNKEHAVKEVANAKATVELLQHFVDDDNELIKRVKRNKREGGTNHKDTSIEYNIQPHHVDSNNNNRRRRKLPEQEALPRKADETKLRGFILTSTVFSDPADDETTTSLQDYLHPLWHESEELIPSSSSSSKETTKSAATTTNEEEPEPISRASVHYVKKFFSTVRHSRAHHDSIPTTESPSKKAPKGIQVRKSKKSKSASSSKGKSVFDYLVFSPSPSMAPSEYIPPSAIPSPDPSTYSPPSTMPTFEPSSSSSFKSKKSKKHKKSSKEIQDYYISSQPSDLSSPSPTFTARSSSKSKSKVKKSKSKKYKMTLPSDGPSTSFAISSSSKESKSSKKSKSEKSKKGDKKKKKSKEEKVTDDNFIPTSLPSPSTLMDRSDVPTMTPSGGGGILTPSPGTAQSPAPGTVQSPAPTLLPDMRIDIPLSPYTIRYEMNATQIPLQVEVDAVVAITQEYLNEYFLANNANIIYMNTTSTGSQFALSAPYEIYYRTIASFPSDAPLPPEAQIEDQLIDALSSPQDLAYIGLLQELPDFNVFSTTSNITHNVTSERAFDTSTSASPLSETRTKATIGAITGALAFVAMIGGTFLLEKRSKTDIHDTVKKDHKDSGYVTVGGDTYPGTATVWSGTSGPQTRFVDERSPYLEDEGLSVGGASEWKNDDTNSRIDFIGDIDDSTLLMEPSETDCLVRAEEGEQRRLNDFDIQDSKLSLLGLDTPLSQVHDTPTSQGLDVQTLQGLDSPLLTHCGPGDNSRTKVSDPLLTSNGGFNEYCDDDCTVDENVPLRVVDLIKRFSPLQTRLHTRQEDRIAKQDGENSQTGEINY